MNGSAHPGAPEAHIVRGWVRDPDPSKSPAVWRRGIWSLQLHPTLVVTALCVWGMTIAVLVGVPKSFFATTFGLVVVIPGILGSCVFSFAFVLEVFMLMAVKVKRSPRRIHLGVMETVCAAGLAAAMLARMFTA